jgi:hypothetical protein
LPVITAGKEDYQKKPKQEGSPPGERTEEVYYFFHLPPPVWGMISR